MDDIVTRLREVGLCSWQTQQEAANEIERLRTENAAMRRQALHNMITLSEHAGMYE